MSIIEERVDTLESILGQFIVHTDVALRRLEREMKEFKDEMRLFREESERDRKALHEEIEAFKKEAEQDRKALHKEMKEFKDEMKEFKRRQEEENKRKNKEWSALAKKMGTIMEDLIAPALRPVLKKYFNCDVILEGQRMFRRKDGEDYEVDAIAACSDKVFMIEVRSTPRDTDVGDIKEKSKRFFEFFPEFKDRDLVIIFGSITFPENVIKYASPSGVYVMGWREWEYMDILNFESVKKR
ncbi:MAG: hypothetical protein D6828_06165 [Nitrospirae bacterium]|nr:MAG: hypothetical protein D6828_06165 [Nitrospirota bacterium]